MNLKQMFSTVSRQTSLSAERFLAFYNETVEDLCAQYGEKYVLASSDDEITDRVSTIYDAPLTLPVFDKSIINNILWLDTKEPSRKELSMAQREHAYNTCWRGKNKRPRVHARGWW